MPVQPLIGYYLGRRQDRLQPDSASWHAPLRSERRAVGPGSDSAQAVRLGDYFLAVQGFLSAHDFAHLTAALTRHFKQQISATALQQIDIYLVKHGELYHPAQIVVRCNNQYVCLVVNVACSQRGREVMTQEYRLLRQLGREYPERYVPRVYAMGRVDQGDGGRFQMFIGEWFEGYHEFHLAEDPSDRQLKLMVWDSEQGPFYLNEQQARQIYRQAAMILTYYYDVASFRQIHPWHHAAGDFVVNCHNGRVDLKLITARGYHALVEHEDADEALALQALWVFLVHLSLRMRLDRRDGTGAIVWAPDLALEETLNGFYHSLQRKPELGNLARSPAKWFARCRQHYHQGLVLALGQSLLGTFHAQAPERELLAHHLEGHVQRLLNLIDAAAP